MLSASGGAGTGAWATGFFVVNLPLNCQGVVASLFFSAAGIDSQREASLARPAPVAVIVRVAGMPLAASGAVAVTFQSALPVDPANVSVVLFMVTSMSSTVVVVRFWK